MASSDLDLNIYMAPWAHMSQSPNDISIGLAVFARLDPNVTNRQTDRLTDRATLSVAGGRCH